jgi:hypothetical protein
MPITVTFTPTYPEFSEAQSALARRLHSCPLILQLFQSAILGAAFLSLFIVAGSMFGNPSAGLFVAGVLLMIYVWTMRRHRENIFTNSYRGAIQGGPVTYLFEDNDVVIEGSTSSARFLWAAVTGYSTSSSLSLLFLRGAVLYVPLRVLDATQRQSLDALIRRHLPVAAPRS